MSIYQHFRKEEQPFIDQVLSWKEQVERSYQAKLTDFLDPRERQIAETVIGTANDVLQIKSFGGGDFTERRRILIAPFYEEITKASFQLTLMQAAYPDKFVSLTHPDVMGAFLSVGIDRRKLGDIFVKAGMVQIITASEIAPYVLVNLTSIKRAKVTMSEASLANLMEKKECWEKIEKTVSSLRLDTIVKEIYRLSRKDAAAYITKKLVKVNFRVVDDGKFNLQEEDMISLRGKGRSKLISVHGQTKKGNLKITIANLK